MKYCLSSRQTKKYLEYADEIMVQQNDFRQISDLIIEHPNKTIILDLKNWTNEEIQKSILEYKSIPEINFVCKIYTLNSDAIEFFTKNNIKFYYGYSVNSFYEVRGLIALGVEYIKVHAPLTFDIKALSSLPCKFRMVPNVAFDAYIPHDNGICGQWVRPEDVSWYEDGIEVFEFENVELQQERTFYDIYTKQKVWDGNLYFLITNLNIHCHNKALPDNFGEIRANCGQKCMKTNVCHFCLNSFLFEKTLREHKDEIKEQLINQKKNN